MWNTVNLCDRFSALLETLIWKTLIDNWFCHFLPSKSNEMITSKWGTWLLSFLFHSPSGQCRILWNPVRSFHWQQCAARAQGVTGKVEHKKFHSNVRKNFFTLRVREHWNKLPRELVESPSMTVFKTCLDVFLCNPVYRASSSRGLRLDDPQRSLPTSTTWLCDHYCVNTLEMKRSIQNVLNSLRHRQIRKVFSILSTRLSICTLMAVMNLEVTLNCYASILP